jgi:hypothetical protein
MNNEYFRNPIDIISENAVLQAAFKYVLENNSSAHAPYHNTNHMMCMLKYSEYILVREYDRKDMTDVLALFLASIMHDMDHTMGLYNDSINVARAMRATRIFIIENKNLIEKNGYSPIVLLNKTRPLIDATEFPYTIKNQDLSDMQKVIRDADLLQAYEPNMFHHLIMGLSKEGNNPIINVLAGNVKFHNMITMRTKTGQAFVDANRPALIEEFEKYIAILEK